METKVYKYNDGVTVTVRTERDFVEVIGILAALRCGRVLTRQEEANLFSYFFEYDFDTYQHTLPIKLVSD